MHGTGVSISLPQHCSLECWTKSTSCLRFMFTIPHSRAIRRVCRGPRFEMPLQALNRRSLAFEAIRSYAMALEAAALRAPGRHSWHRHRGSKPQLHLGLAPMLLRRCAGGKYLHYHSCCCTIPVLPVFRASGGRGSCGNGVLRPM